MFTYFKNKEYMYENYACKSCDDEHFLIFEFP